MPDRDELEQQHRLDEPSAPDAPQKARIKWSDKLLCYGAMLLFCGFLQPSVSDWPLKSLSPYMQHKFHLISLVGLPLTFWYAFLRPCRPR